MSADWKAGDRALCVEPFRMTNDFGQSPTVGVIYLVTGIAPMDEKGKTGLFIAGVPAYEELGFGWWDARFRKIVPACDRAGIMMRYHPPGDV